MSEYDGTPTHPPSWCTTWIQRLPRSAPGGSTPRPPAGGSYSPTISTSSMSLSDFDKKVDCDFRVRFIRNITSCVTLLITYL